MKKVFQIIGALVVVGVIMSAMGGDDEVPAETAASTVDSETEETEERQPEGERAGVGEKVRDGKFEFAVSGIECGIEKAGDNEYLTATAQGQFCALELTVTNIGDEPQHLFADNQKLFDAKGREFSSSGEATLYGNEGSDVFLSEINPGNTVSGKIFFDIPKDATPAYVELHDSAFSGGVEVDLS